MENKNYISLIIIIVMAAAGVFAWFYLAPGSSVTREPVQMNKPAEETSASKEIMDTTKLLVEILRAGQGKEAKVGNEVTVHYTGWLTNGTKFDSSVDRGRPFSFLLGAGQVIQGWDKGVLGMKVGEKRKLTIPSDLGYGQSGTPGGPIPPNAVLIFEVELLAIN